MIGIYKITNLINNQSYIGQSINIEQRIKQHFRNKDKTAIDNAIQKYGKENFQWEIVEECSLKELNEREQYWILYYDTYRHGYNQTWGGVEGSIYGESNPSSKLKEEYIVWLRERYNAKDYVSQKDLYQVFQEKFNVSISLTSFRQAFTGITWDHIMPEVFTNENYNYMRQQWYNNHNCHKTIGENTGGVKATEDDILKIRILYITHTRNDIFNIFPQYSKSLIENAISGRRWKHLPYWAKMKKQWIFPSNYTETQKIEFLERIKHYE